MTRLTRWLIVGLLVLLCSGFALAQQPVQDLGSGSINTSLASWTSATSVPTCVTPVSNTSQYNSVLVTLIQPSGLTGGVVTFKESLDNSNYFTVQGVQLGTTAIVGPTYTMQASTTAAFLFPLGAAPYFEVCLTTAITGSGTTTVQDALQSFAQAALLAGTQTLAAGSNTIGNVGLVAGSASIGTVGLNAGSNNIGSIDILGHAGAAVDSTVGAGTAPANDVVTGGIYNSSPPAPTNGQSVANQLDAAGNQMVSLGMVAQAMTAITSSNGTLNATFTIFTNSGAPDVLVQLDQTTTITAGAISFRVSWDGTNFVTISSDAVIDPTSATYATISLPYTLQASTNKAFLLTMKGAQALQIIVSTAMTGTGTVTPHFALLSYLPTHTVTANAGSGNFGMNLAQVLGATHSKTNSVFSALSDQTNVITAAISALGTAPTGTEVLAVNNVALPSTAAGTALSSAAQATLTSSVNVKASAGNVFGVSVLSGATTGCWLEFINSASAGTLGTAVIFSIALPNAGIVTIPPGEFPLGSFSNGIAMGVATTNGGASACGTSSSVTVFYK